MSMLSHFAFPCGGAFNHYYFGFLILTLANRLLVLLFKKKIKPNDLKKRLPTEMSMQVSRHSCSRITFGVP